VNPRHLFLGTHDDNMADMVSKNRQARGAKLARRKMPSGDEHYSRKNPERLARGESHGQARVTEGDVRVIRERYKDGEKLSQLARDFRITYQAVGRIVRREVWKSIV